MIHNDLTAGVLQCVIGAIIGSVITHAIDVWREKPRLRNCEERALRRIFNR
jgi:hypothetical protein